MIRWVRSNPDAGIDTTRWPATVPAVEQILAEGLELTPGLTVLVGENGSGKSTVVEVLAEACGLNPQGGSGKARFRTRDSEPGIGRHLRVEREPDAPLSFTSCLGLVALLHDLAQAGSQAVVATHSPVVAAVPGARILELGDWGIRPARWDDLHLTGAWRQFMAEPEYYFRHLFSD